ncbi:MAG: type II toxin-antitoxin system PemK/MazF family toxin [Desulfobacterales bacterium]|nr:type II toxin-antitoxin system PemK/MazF family toxin [Desulfobacterales bacterium]
MPATKYFPRRGDIVWTDFDPAAGHEQMGKRPALVLSPTPFNRKIRLALVAPITSRERGHGFEVHLHGTRVRGVVLCHQVRVIDFVERGVRFAEKAPDAVIADALARVRVLVDD